MKLAVPLKTGLPAFFLILLNACATQATIDEHAREWIDRPVKELKQEMKRPDSYASEIGWKETTYTLANGNYVYVEPFRNDCAIHWEINSNGLIIGYQAKGINCSDRSPYSDGISHQKTSGD